MATTLTPGADGWAWARPANSNTVSTSIENRNLFIALRVDSLEFFDPGLRLSPRSAVPVEERRRDLGLGQHFGPPHDSLLNVDRGCADLIDRADDLHI